MPEIICITGFLGAGKTTLLNKILPLCLDKGKVAVIENDFGDTGIDAALLAWTGAKVRELASGCICCSLRGELKPALESLIRSENPGIIFIEPSGISRSSDILSGLKALEDSGSVSIVNVVNLLDISNFEDYLDSFGDFYGDQLKSARTILFSHRQGLSQEQLDNLAGLVRAMNPGAACLISDWLELDQELLWAFIQGTSGADRATPSAPQLSDLEPGRSNGGAFSYWSCFPEHPFSRQGLEAALGFLAVGRAGAVLRAKGFCRAPEGSGWHFDYLKGHSEIKSASSFGQGRVLVIGQNLNTERLTELFRN